MTRTPESHAKTRSDIAGLPKAVLHEHLDGGLRVETVLEIADAEGYRGLPSYEPDGLRDWFHQGRSGSLERYLEAFEHTVAVMQTESGIERVAFEAVEDLANDGVVYAEIRFAPSLNTRGGLSRRQVLTAAWEGMQRATAIHDITVGIIVTAMRQDSDSAAVAADAIAMMDSGVIGFDLAGPEAGFPPDRHLEACLAVRGAGLGLTIHAGEGDGVNSMWRALARCGAQRIGHGVRIVEDTDFDGTTMSQLGRFARRVRDHRVPLEIAPTSNLHTGTYTDAASHPLGQLYRAGYNVSINTDNRLMSGVTMTDEFALTADAFGFDLPEWEDITVRTIESGFGDLSERRRLIEEKVGPAYEAARTASGRSNR